MGSNLALRTTERLPEKPPPISDREALVNEFLPGIRYHASIMKLRLPPNVEMDDLVSSGVVGLLDAAEKFDSTRGIKFKTYAEFRIRGSMLDYLREMDWFSRAARQNANRLENAYARLEALLGRPPLEEEVAKEMKISITELRKQLALFSGLSVFSLDEPEDEYSVGNTAVQRILTEAAKNDERKDSILRDLREVLGKAIDLLPDREKQLIALYYYEELTMKEIGAIFALGEPRICQLHSQAVLRLRGKLKSRLER
ncbi:MAG TPA: FliA/WhiG family RNA polymerase sigma factor [Candidatus Deferrimicrobiaceae bacterium]|nr:FliA/WhiG family RNA polymerase sigma factor [Candidatus Deferrimicrobiaceae bacterium]